MKYVFLRADDACKADKSFKRIFITLKKNEIPVVYGIIPRLATKSLIQLLNKEKRKNPKLFDITQHGLKHKNYGGKIRNKYEFGPSRTLTRQRKDISAGYSKMKELFGKNFTPAFIPPYNSYDENTLKIINELKIPIFSSNKKAGYNLKKLLDLPIDISLNDYDSKNRPVILSSKVMIKRLISSLKTKRIFQGILLHHNFFIKDEDFEELRIFLNFLKKLQGRKQIQIILFSDLLKKRSLKL